MPTPVNIARQCLAPEAAQALDDAVSVAHRRSHTQTSSLHAISALLSLPSSPLREACGRARNSAFTSRIQFKGLELCLGVSLDRLPSTPQRVDEPPVSNSLMAAIKRSQANQRRQPENFHLYQQTTSCSPSSASVSMVKVELQNLILSILDDPVVSRVFGESGFRNSDIKLSILRPVHRHLLRCKGQPVFLCNLNSNFSFPFHGFLENSEICRRINEILIRKQGKKRNSPLIIGPSAIDAVSMFLETLQKRKIGAFSPPELSGLSVLCIKDEISSFVNGNSDVGLLKLRFEEVSSVLKQGIGPGVIVEFGDLKPLIGENSMDSVSFVVEKLGGLMAVHSGRLWLIGAAESHETCLQFYKNFPSVEEDWDLHVLPINSIRPRITETFPKSSFMESFVPFGGFFSMPSDIKNPLRISNHFGSLCHICDDKFKQEVSDVSKGGLNGSVLDHYQSSLPSWLQMSHLCTNREIDAPKAQDDPIIRSAKIVRLQKKWHNICHRLHQPEPYAQILPKVTYTAGPQIPSVIGFQVVKNLNQNILDQNSSSIESPCDTYKDSPVVCSLSGSNEHNDTASRVSGNSVTIDQKDYKMLYSSLFTRVGRQEEALGVVSRTVARCRAQPVPNRGGIWFGFVGPDSAGKKKTAAALAEVLFGGPENDIICVDLSCRDFMDGTDLKLRGKNIVDFIADEISKKPLSVVFLENVEMADMLTQQHLTRAASSGRFSDSHGREVSIGNAILVLSFGPGPGPEPEGIDYIEENVLKAKSGPIRMLTGFDLGDSNPSPKVVRVMRNNRACSPVSKNKRKLNSGLEVAKRGYRTGSNNNMFLDLNQPAGDSDTDYDSAPENVNIWMDDLLEKVDEKVIFKAFDFDELAEKILKRIGDCFEKIVGVECWLEINFKVMERILKASSFLLPEKMEDWVDRVLAGAFAEARNKYGLSSHSVVKLIPAELPEEQLTGDLLPARIIMN